MFERFGVTTCIRQDESDSHLNVKVKISCGDLAQQIKCLVVLALFTQDVAEVKSCAIFLWVMFEQYFKMGFRLIPKHKALTQYPGCIKRVDVFRVMRQQFLKLLQR